MNRRRTKLSMAPMAIASDGSIVVNAAQLGTKSDLTSVVECAARSGLAVFVGVVVPGRMAEQFLKNVDDSMADIVGRLGPRLVKPIQRRRLDVAGKIRRTPS